MSSVLIEKEKKNLDAKKTCDFHYSEMSVKTKIIDNYFSVRLPCTELIFLCNCQARGNFYSINKNVLWV